MTRLVEFPLEDGTSVYIEVDDKLSRSESQEDEDRIGVKDEIVRRASQTFEDALSSIKPVANAIINKVQSFNQPADEVEVKFGLKLSAELGAVIASGNAEVNYEITLKWSHQSQTTNTDKNQ
jgi:hypothetical protein